MTAGLIVLLVVAAFVLLTLGRTIRIVPQARAGVVERLGRYSRTLSPGLAIVVPFIDRVRDMMDLREQVVSFDPQPVITEDNLVVSIDTVIYFQVTDARAATYEIANYIQAIEQLTVTTLRNVIGGMALEETLTSRDEINDKLRGVLDEATGKWGIRVNRVEIKAIDPPSSIKDAMEKQMRADRDKREPLRERSPRERGGELGGEPRLLVGPVLQLAEIGAAEQLAEAPEEPRLERGDGEEAPVGGRVDAVAREAAGEEAVVPGAET